MTIFDRISVWSPAAIVAVLALLALGQVATPTGAATPVHADDDGLCGGLAPCFSTIQEAVDNAGPAPAEVLVFPGNYNERVLLNSMGSDIAGSPGDITLTTVDGNGTPTPRTATVSPSTLEAIEANCTYPGAITIDGFVVTSPDNEGIQLCADGDVTIVNVLALNNGGDGFWIDITGNLTVTHSSAIGNGEEGFEIHRASDVTFDGVTSEGNVSDGIDLEPIGENGTDIDNTTIRNSRLEENIDDGVETSGPFDPAGLHVLSASVLCGNGDGGVSVEDPLTLLAEGNWWGAATGPTHPDNPTGTGEEVFDGGNGMSGTVDFHPWIDSVSGDAGAATAGEPVTVTFEFTGGSGAVGLGEGPGDPNGSSPFGASTDNGTVVTTGFLQGGKLEITLTPAAAGTATVAVTGPCALDDAIGGNSVVLDVSEAPADATQTSTPTPAELPPTGSEPGGRSDPPWPALVVIGIVALVGASALTLNLRRTP